MIIMIPNDNDNHNNDQMITTDRISELPNDLLHQILSLLPIKTVAQTSLKLQVLLEINKNNFYRRKSLLYVVEGKFFNN